MKRTRAALEDLLHEHDLVSEQRKAAAMIDGRLQQGQEVFSAVEETIQFYNSRGGRKVLSREDPRLVALVAAVQKWSVAPAPEPLTPEAQAQRRADVERIIQPIFERVYRGAYEGDWLDVDTNRFDLDPAAYLETIAAQFSVRLSGYACNRELVDYVAARWSPPTPLVMSDLVQALDQALRARDREILGCERSRERGQPASNVQLARLKSIWQAPLSRSYRAFMELHNGWSDFVGDAKLLSVEDQGSDWVRETRTLIDQRFGDAKDPPFAHGRVPVMLGKTAKGFLVVDPSTLRRDGEMDFVAYYLDHEEERFGSFAEFLEHRLRLAQEMILDDEVPPI